jgi:hypothetical protein
MGLCRSAAAAEVPRRPFRPQGTASLRQGGAETTSMTKRAWQELPAPDRPREVEHWELGNRGAGTANTPVWKVYCVPASVVRGICNVDELVANASITKVSQMVWTGCMPSGGEPCGQRSRKVRIKRTRIHPEGAAGDILLWSPCRQCER